MQREYKAQAPLEIRHRRCMPCRRQAPLEIPEKLSLKHKFLTGQGSLTGQVSLELATAFICMFILVLASVKIATWVAGRMVVRQEDFETSQNYGRVTAGSTNIGVEVDESNPTRYQELHFFE